MFELAGGLGPPTVSPGDMLRLLLVFPTRIIRVLPA